MRTYSNSFHNHAAFFCSIHHLIVDTAVYISFHPLARKHVHALKGLAQLQLASRARRSRRACCGCTRPSRARLCHRNSKILPDGSKASKGTRGYTTSAFLSSHVCSLGSPESRVFVILLGGLWQTIVKLDNSDSSRNCVWSQWSEWTMHIKSPQGIDETDTATNLEI
jgi:hypothetical protein